MPKSTSPDWYLADWLRHAGKRQADLVKDLGWPKARASYVVGGRQPYRREVVNEISAWLGIEPYELLMPPHEAMQLRQLRSAAIAIAAAASHSEPG